MSVNVISPRSISGRLLHHLLLLLVLLLAKGTAVSRVAEFPRADTAQAWPACRIPDDGHPVQDVPFVNNYLRSWPCLCVDAFFPGLPHRRPAVRGPFSYGWVWEKRGLGPAVKVSSEEPKPRAGPLCEERGDELRGVINKLEEDFLEKYGYLRQEEHKHSSAELDSALREFQWLSQLPVTGQLDSVTLQQMGAPRCGVRDGRSHRAWSHRINGLLKGEVATTSGHRRMKRYARTGDRWHKRHLTYRIVNGPRHLSTGQVRLAVRAAFQLWSNVSALAFREVAEGPADIRLAFFEGEHDDGTGNAFDGPGGALAHAFFPCRGEAHFDMAERWTLHSRKGHNLFMVVAHEIGHTLGLEHSPLRRALMSPYYRKLGKALVLSWDDIIAVQQLYGKPADGKLTQSSGRAFMSALQDWEQTQTEEDRGSSPPLYCEGTFDAITMDEDEMVLVFRGGLFWVVSPQGGVSAPAPLQRRWPQLPPTIEAAAFSPVDGKFYFFKGRRLWRYSNSSLDPGFPRNHAEASLPRRPDCAFYYPPLGHMILFKSSQYFVLNLKTLLPEPYYPRGLEDWKGLPRGTHGALSRSDGHLYVFKGHRYWQFNLAKVRVSGHGIWAQDLQWVGCQKTRSVNDVL